MTLAGGSGGATFGGVVGGNASLASLSVSGSGNTTIDATAIDTTGGQTYSGSVIVAKTTTLNSGGAIDFAGAVDGAVAGSEGLTLAAGANSVTLSGAMGGAAALKTLAVTGTGNAAINGGAVNTTGAQTYDGTVSLGGDTNITSSGGGNILFKGAVTGGSNALSVNSGAGNITMDAAVSAGAVTLNGGNVTWDAALTGTGLDIFGTNLVMKGNVTATTSAGVLMVAGSTFKNTGHDSISLTGGGTWLIYSVSPGDNVLGGLTGSSEFNTSYPTAPDFSGNGFLYSAAD